jgi:hypothetical protein
MIPLRGISISTMVDGVEVYGEIVSLYPNDITVALIAPVGGLSCGLHVPYFAMGHHPVATSHAGRTIAITAHGQRSAEWLLKQTYDYSRGRPVTWRVEPR